MKSDLPYVGLSAPELQGAARAAPGRAPLRRPRARGRPPSWSSGTTPRTARSGTPPSPCCATAPTATGGPRPRCRCSSTWCAPAPGGTSSTRSPSHLVGQVLLDHRASVPRSWTRGPSTPPASGSGVRRCWRSCGTAGTPTPTCSSGCWSPTSTTRRTAASSSSARRSAGRCASTRGRTPRGCGPSSRPTPTGSAGCHAARRSSTSGVARRHPLSSRLIAPSASALTPGRARPRRTA